MGYLFVLLYSLPSEGSYFTEHMQVYVALYNSYISFSSVSSTPPYPKKLKVIRNINLLWYGSATTLLHLCKVAHEQLFKILHLVQQLPCCVIYIT